MKAKITSLLTLFLIAAIWGFAFVAQAEGSDHLGSFAFNGIRFAIGALSLLPVVLVVERGRDTRELRRKTLFASMLAGTVLFCASSLQQFGIEITRSAGVAGFITGLYTVLIPISCFLLFKSKTKGNVWIGAFLAVAGLFLLCYTPGEGLSFGLGELILLIGSFLWTAHIIIVDKLGASLRSLHFALGQFTFCAILGLVAMFFFDPPAMEGILSAKWSLLYCGVLSVGVAYTLQIVAQKKADPTYAAIILSTESLFSALGGALFGIDSISTLGYLGCLLMFSGVLVSQIDFGRKGNA
jgi:drug/metabolite transporter (DMT)-like permease